MLYESTYRSYVLYHFSCNSSYNLSSFLFLMEIFKDHFRSKIQRLFLKRGQIQSVTKVTTFQFLTFGSSPDMGLSQDSHGSHPGNVNINITHWWDHRCPFNWQARVLWKNHIGTTLFRVYFKRYTIKIFNTKILNRFALLQVNAPMFTDQHSLRLLMFSNKPVLLV